MNLCGKKVGENERLFLVAGPCVIESLETALKTADRLAALAQRFGVLVIYKSSFDKANRSSPNAYRGPGIEKGLEILWKIKRASGLPVTTDIHQPDQLALVEEVVDLIQIPALLARQTDLIESAAKSNRPVHIKKTQNMSYENIRAVVHKARNAASVAGLDHDKFLVGERGTAFGLDDLVVDMRGLEIMREMHIPIIFDASHSFRP